MVLRVVWDSIFSLVLGRERSRRLVIALGISGDIEESEDVRMLLSVSTERRQYGLNL